MVSLCDSLAFPVFGPGDWKRRDFRGVELIAIETLVCLYRMWEIWRIWIVCMVFKWTETGRGGSKMYIWLLLRIGDDNGGRVVSLGR